MARGYQTEDIKEKLVDLLTNSKTGLSGLEISERLEINRITTTKYLSIFAAEGLIKQKNIGNVNLWFIEDGTEKFHFPEDFFKVKTKYIEYLTARKEHQVYNLVRNSFHSTTQPVKIITEIVVPAIESIYTIFDQGKIGKSELNFLEKTISNSIQITKGYGKTYLLTAFKTTSSKPLVGIPRLSRNSQILGRIDLFGEEMI